jgi:predicted small lipoprotein YifL
MSRLLVILSLVSLAACGRASPGAPDGGPGVDAEVDPGPDAEVPDYSRVYAHSGQDLYRIDTTDLEVILVGPFGAATGTASITDIAIDKDDRMLGVTLGAIFEIDETTGTATHLADFTGADGFTSLSFVPVDPADPDSAEELIAANDQGAVFRIDPTTGAAEQVGSYGTHEGMTIRSSGDIVSVRGFGTLATVTLGDTLTDPDYLAWVDPTTWTATPIGTAGAGYDRIFGLGFWQGQIYGFIDDGAGAGTGSLVTIDPTTGTSTHVDTRLFRWYGAGVTTDAPIVD